MEDWSRAQGLTGGTTSKLNMAHRTLMEGRIFMADQRRAGDPGRVTKEGEWGGTGAVDTEL